MGVAVTAQGPAPSSERCACSRDRRCHEGLEAGSSSWPLSTRPVSDRRRHSLSGAVTPEDVKPGGPFDVLTLQSSRLSVEKEKHMPRASCGCLCPPARPVSWGLAPPAGLLHALPRRQEPELHGSLVFGERASVPAGPLRGRARVAVSPRSWKCLHVCIVSAVFVFRGQNQAQ